MNIKMATIQLRHDAGVGLIELLIALILFSVCILTLARLQIKAGMEGLDNHQRAVALWSARGLVDRISANSSQDAISEYETRINGISDCAAYSVKYCESKSAASEVPSCGAKELAAHDVWSTFCEGENSVNAQLIEYDAALTCGGPCATDSNMTLRLTWISKVSDSDDRLIATTSDRAAGGTPGNLDFITLDFRP